jgi:hypothetical protein
MNNFRVGFAMRLHVYAAAGAKAEASRGDRQGASADVKERGEWLPSGK